MKFLGAFLVLLGLIMLGVLAFLSMPVNMSSLSLSNQGTETWTGMTITIVGVILFVGVNVFSM